MTKAAPLDIVNLQKQVELDIKGLRNFGKQLAETVREASGRRFSTAFVDDGRIAELNLTFRNKNSPTDVLSFPHEPDDFDPDKDFLGDIIISAETAQKQAEDAGLTLDEEICQLMLHGLLHLCGYDHENDVGEMNQRELELRSELGI